LSVCRRDDRKGRREASGHESNNDLHVTLPRLPKQGCAKIWESILKSGRPPSTVQIWNGPVRLPDVALLSAPFVPQPPEVALRDLLSAKT
jgi:hypothetical protein